MTKKKKWTAQQRAKFIATMKSKRSKSKLKPDGPNENEAIQQAKYEEHIIFAHGHIKGWLNFFAASIGIPERDLAYRVGELLQLGKGRQKVRS